MAGMEEMDKSTAAEKKAKKETKLKSQAATGHAARGVAYLS